MQRDCHMRAVLVCHVRYRRTRNRILTGGQAVNTAYPAINPAANPAANPAGPDGAQEKTRTSTTLRPLTPEASASTNSATWARYRSGYDIGPFPVNGFQQF